MLYYVNCSNNFVTLNLCVSKNCIIFPCQFYKSITIKLDSNYKLVYTKFHYYFYWTSDHTLLNIKLYISNVRRLFHIWQHCKQNTSERRFPIVWPATERSDWLDRKRIVRDSLCRLVRDRIHMYRKIRTYV